MRRFINGGQSVFDELKRLATRRGGTLFLDVEMPLGSDPARATVGCDLIGFHADSATMPIFFVMGQVRYSGSHPQAADWLKRGCKIFGSFNELRNWIKECLAGAYSVEEDSDASVSQR